MTIKETHYIYDENGNLSGTIYKTEKGRIVTIKGNYDPTNEIIIRDLGLEKNIYDSYLTNTLKEILLPFQENIYPIKMYQIELGNYKIVCEDCFTNGKVNENCKRCNGEGTYQDTKLKWFVSNELISIIKIDRCKTGDLRYWINKNHTYGESQKLLHFTKEDAFNECERRNKLIDKEGEK